MGLTPRLLRPADAETYVGGEAMLRYFKERGWLRPVVTRNRLTLYDRLDIDVAADRLKVEGWRDED
jgi:hypothetical protein